MERLGVAIRVGYLARNWRWRELERRPLVAWLTVCPKGGQVFEWLAVNPFAAMAKLLTPLIFREFFVASFWQRLCNGYVSTV
jgi:hypothetical protein